jgi:hypothetical protein
MVDKELISGTSLQVTYLNTDYPAGMCFEGASLAVSGYPVAGGGTVIPAAEKIPLGKITYIK